jgi:hypothetical protein
MNLITYQAKHFVREMSSNPNYKIWIDFYKIFNDWSIGITDRTGNFSFPIKTIIPKNMHAPAFSVNNITYRECCINRAKEILQKQNDLDIPIHIMYSGGIDSTAVLCSFIDLLGVKGAADRVVLKMSKESIDENPFFWYKFIRPYFKIEESDFGYNELDFGKIIYVTGELNDQLFGSDIQQHFSLFGGDEFLNHSADVGLLQSFFEKFKGLSEVSAKFWAESFYKNLDYCPNHYGKMWDIMWWYNFSWKWIYVYYRVFLYSKAEGPINKSWLENNYFPFFATDDFQLWSMNNNEPKHLGLWSTYKYTAKKYISDVSMNPEYMKKVKRQSLQNIVHLRPIEHAMTENYEIIDTKTIPIDMVLRENTKN